MNHNIPYINCYVRNTFLFNLNETQGVTECYVFGVKCLLNRPISFHCQLINGAIFWSLPISAFVTKENYIILNSEEQLINECLWWNCQSNNCDVTVFRYLEGSFANLISRTGVTRTCRYLFTIDDYYENNDLPLGYAQDTDSKCFHVFECIKTKWLMAYPNDKIRWHNPNFVEGDLEIPKYKAYQHDLRAETII